MKELEIIGKELEGFTCYAKGFESTLYLQGDTLIKRYYDMDPTLLQKIDYFHNLKIENITKPKEILKVDGEYKGYTMDFLRGYYPIGNYKDLGIPTKIELLKKIKPILRELHQNGIIYGDLNPTNVISNEEEVFLCDIVNSKTSRFDFSEKSHTMVEYLNKGGQMDANLDHYMFNLLTIFFLNDIEYSDILPRIENALIQHFHNEEYEPIIGITDNLECMDIGFQLLDPKNEIHELLIDKIDPELYKEKITK